MNGLGASVVIGNLIMTRNIAFGKNGTAGHKYGTPIGLNAHK